MLGVTVRLMSTNRPLAGGNLTPPALQVPSALGDPFNRSRASVVHLTPFYNASCPRQTQPQEVSTLNKAN